MVPTPTPCTPDFREPNDTGDSVSDLGTHTIGSSLVQQMIVNATACQGDTDLYRITLNEPPGIFCIPDVGNPDRINISFTNLSPNVAWTLGPNLSQQQAGGGNFSFTYPPCDNGWPSSWTYYLRFVPNTPTVTGSGAYSFRINTAYGPNGF